MIVSDRPYVAAEFLKKHSSGVEHPVVCQSFVNYNSAGEVTAAVAYHHHNGRSVLGDIAFAGAAFPRHFLHVTLWYAFESLKVRRLTMFVAADNLKSIAFVEKLGAYRGATLIDGCSSGDAWIYYLLSDQCPLWSRFNGKIISASSPGSPGPTGAGPSSGN